MSRWIRWASALLLTLMVGACGGGSKKSPAEPVFFPLSGAMVYQYDFVDYGALNLNFTQYGGIHYQLDLPVGDYFLNAVIPQPSGHAWQVHNLPVHAPGGRFDFVVAIDLSQVQPAPGAMVPQLDHASTLSDLPLTQPPLDFETVPVIGHPITFETGIIGGVPVAAPPNPPMVFEYDGVSFSVDTAGHDTFVNQDCGKNECTPTAVSNSMKTIGVGTDAQNSIATIKPIVQWGANGAPVRWDINKAAQTAGAPYNLTTTRLDPKADTREARIQKLCQAQEALRAGSDVEMDNPWHTAMVTRITKTTSGGTTKYYIWVAHDTVQGTAGGTKEEPLEYDPSTNRLSGGTAGFFNGSIIDQWVIEAK